MRAKRQLLCFPVASALSPLLSKSFPLVSTAKRPCAVTMSAHADDAAAGKRVRLSAAFRETDVAAARELTDGVGLRAAGGGADDPVILPFVGFGTYKLGRDVARSATLEALVRGYRCVDTAFIYGGETTERQVGLAIQGERGRKIRRIAAAAVAAVARSLTRCFPHFPARARQMPWTKTSSRTDAATCLSSPSIGESTTDTTRPRNACG